MKINNYENENIFKILNTKSRIATLSNVELEEIHKKLGELLSYKFLEEFKLKEVEIDHVQGKKIGYALDKKEKFLIIVLMRGGLYVANGFKNIFDNQFDFEMINSSDEIEKIKNKYNLNEMNVIIVDSVINTGKSMKKVVDLLPKNKKIYIVSLVMQENAKNVFKNYDNLAFYISRLSKNFYVGKGNFDTGNRLFNSKKVNK
jgi:uracil phosphoribosyltransferase